MKIYAALKLNLYATLIILISACAQSHDPLLAKKSEAFDHVANAVALQNQATELVNLPPTLQSLPQEEFNKIKALWLASLIEAKKVDIRLLNAVDPGFGDLFQEKFIHGLELCTSGDASELIKGQFLLSEFGDELNAIKAKKHSHKSAVSDQ